MNVRPALSPTLPAPTRRPQGTASQARPLSMQGDTLALGWDRKGYLPPSSQQPLPEADALATGKRLFSISEAKSKAEARQVGDFFDRHPSIGASQIVFFHSWWAQNQTFQTHPLQAYLYSTTRPVNDAGEPKNALWQAYARAAGSGQPQAEVERAFLRAHLHEFKQVIRTPEFKELFALATPDYRKVVEAYLDTLQEIEGDLAKGQDPVQASRWIFTDTVKWLQRHDTRNNGFMMTAEGLKASLDPREPLTRQIWGSFFDIAKGMAFGRP